MKKILILIIISSLFFLSSCTQTVVTGGTSIPLDENNAVPVNIQDYNGKLFSYFLTQELQSTTLTEDTVFMGFNVTVDNTTNCVVGDALDLVDQNNNFQGIITSIDDNIISFVPSLVNNFELETTEVKCGEWNMAVDGSSIKQTFTFDVPSNVTLDLESIAVQFKDNSDWDINTFGSRTSLENGFTAGIQDGQYTRFFLIYNNGGFSLRGFNIEDIEKAPSGLYGFTANLEFEKSYGAIPALYGEDDDKFVANINDDLTSQTEIAFIVRGHYKDD